MLCVPGQNTLPAPPRSQGRVTLFSLLLYVLGTWEICIKCWVAPARGKPSTSCRNDCFWEFYKEFLSCLRTLFFFVLCDGVLTLGRKLWKFSREDVKLYWFLIKLNIELPWDPAIPHLGYTLMENRCSNKTYTWIQRSIIHNSQQVETVQMSTIQWINIHVVYLGNEILFSHGKEWSNEICHNVDKPQKHYSLWKRPDAKGHMLYDSIYMKSPESANP